MEAHFGKPSDTRVAWKLSIRDFEMERNLEIPTRSNVVYWDTEEKCCSWQDALRTPYAEPVVVWHFIRSGLHEWRQLPLHSLQEYQVARFAGLWEARAEFLKLSVLPAFFTGIIHSN